MWILRKRESRSLHTPAWYSWKAIRAVADDGQVVGNRRWIHSELGYDSTFIAQNITPAVQLNYP